MIEARRNTKIRDKKKSENTHPEPFVMKLSLAKVIKAVLLTIGSFPEEEIDDIVQEIQANILDF